MFLFTKQPSLSIVRLLRRCKTTSKHIGFLNGYIRKCGTRIYFSPSLVLSVLVCPRLKGEIKIFIFEHKYFDISSFE